MWYMFSHLWFWLLCAFVIGSFVGWKTCGGKRT